MPLKTPWSIFHLGTQKSNFSLFGELHLHCFMKQNERKQSRSVKALSTKDLACMESLTNPPLCQSLTPYRNTDFTARIEWWTPDVLSILNYSMILRPYFCFLWSRLWCLRLKFGPLCFHGKKSIALRIISLKESRNLHAQESLS